MTISIKSPTSTTGSIQKNGSDVLTFDSSDNVTVVNNLSVSGTVSSTGDINFDSGTLYVDATNNRVGVGTSSPNTLLHVQGSNSGGNIVAATLRNNNAADSTQTSLRFTNSTSDGTSGGGELSYLRNVGNQGSSFIIKVQNDVGTHIERMRVASDNKVYINTTSSPPSSDGFVFDNTGAGGYSFMDIGHFNGATTTGSYVRFYYGGNQIGRIAGASASSVQYLTTSDYRLKENNVNITDGIERVKLLKPYRFNFIVEPEKTVDGFYAHEVQDIVPEAVNGNKDEVDAEGNPEYQGIDQSKLVPLLTAALQEAITKIEDLETRIQALENPS